MRRKRICKGVAVRAMILRKIVSLEEVDSPLELVKDLPVPDPEFGEVRIRRGSLWSLSYGT
jgi:hypothetical protein